MALPQYLSKIRQLIANDELPAALQQLRALLENSPKLDEVIQQSGRFTHIRKQIRLGTVHFEDATVTRNQISAALLELLSEIEKEGIKPELAAEVEKAISIVNSKNAISNSNIDAGRDIHIGDKIINYGERKIPRLLTDPPFIPGLFLGRTDDLKRIQEQLFAPNSHLLLLVNGEGGVGKTSIASQYFHTHQEKYAHVAWVFSEKSIASALLQLAIPLGLQFDERADALERLRILIQAMFELKKPCLLIIDNANELNELQAYLPHLQRCSNFHILFTTRISDYPQVNFYKIEPLPQDLALQAFKSHYLAFEASEETLFFDIYTAVQGNTLVLELLAKNLNNFNNKLKKRYLLADLKRDLEQSLLGLSKSEKVQTIYQGLREESPESIIAAMYELGDLPAEESTLLSVFAVLPAESIPFERLETLLPDHAELDTHLLALAQKGWIEYNADAAAFKCSPVVQEVVRVKQGNLLENCAALINALCTQLNSENLHLDNYQHSTLFVRYAEAVLGSFAIADDNLGTLCQNIGKYYTDTGDLGKALIAYQKMETIQSKLLKDQPDDADFKNGLAISYAKLGQIHRTLGNLQQALTFFEDYNNLEKELYAADPQNVSFKNNLAISACWIGMTQRDLSNLQQALTFFEDYNTLEKELYAADPQNVSFKNNLAISYLKLGQTHRDLGNLQQALTSFEDYNNLEKELYAAYPQNVKFKNGLAVSYAQIGAFYRDQKEDPQKAKQYFQQCYTLWQELSEAYPAYVEFSKNFDWAKEAMGEEGGGE